MALTTEEQQELAALLEKMDTYEKKSFFQKLKETRDGNLMDMPTSDDKKRLGELKSKLKESGGETPKAPAESKAKEEPPKEEPKESTTTPPSNVVGKGQTASAGGAVVEGAAPETPPSNVVGKGQTASAGGAVVEGAAPQAPTSNKPDDRVFIQGSSYKAVANAQPGQWIRNSKGERQLTQGDINWAKQKLAEQSAPKQTTPNTPTEIRRDNNAGDRLAAKYEEWKKQYGPEKALSMFQQGVAPNLENDEQVQRYIEAKKKILSAVKPGITG